MPYLPSHRPWHQIVTRLAILLSLPAIVLSAEAQFSQVSAAPAENPDPTPASTLTEVRPSPRPLLQVDNLKTYRHPNNLFSIDLPQTWQVENFSQPNRVKLQWQDRDLDALICVELVRVSRQFTSEEQGEELTKILKRVYAAYPRLNIKRPVKQPNGSVRVSWSYQNGGSDRAPIYYSGNSFMQQYGNKLSGSYYVISSQQYARSKDVWTQIINSYQANNAIDIP